MSKLRVFIVDDHPVVRDGLKSLVAGEADMEVVGEAIEGESAVRQALELRPDVVVMDVSMPGMSGIEATEQIRRGSPDTRVIALTAHEDRGYLKQVMATGASGYVLKRSAGANLIGAVRRVAAGKTYVDPVVVDERGAVPRAMVTGDRPELSEREVETLKQIARGYSNKQIAVRLNISVKTVEAYKTRAMEKLGAKSRVDIVRHAAEHGWLTGE